MFACLYSLSTPVAALVKLAEDFTPRFEVVGPVVMLDVGGLSRLLGTPQDIGEHLRRAASGPVRIALAPTQTAAALLALGRPGLTIVMAGEQPEHLASLPVSLLADFDRLRLDPALPRVPVVPPPRKPPVQPPQVSPMSDVLPYFTSCLERTTETIVTAHCGGGGWMHPRDSHAANHTRRSRREPEVPPASARVDDPGELRRGLAGAASGGVGGHDIEHADVASALSTVTPATAGLKTRRSDGLAEAASVSGGAGRHAALTEIQSLQDILRRWGIKTLGALAVLPAGDVYERLGARGVLWQRLARGEDTSPLVPWIPEDPFDASLDLEWPIEGLEPLSFVLGRLLEPMAERLERADRGAAIVHTHLRLVSKAVHARTLQLPAPMRDPKTLRTLVLLDLESNPPAAAIDRVSVLVEPTPARVTQWQLFERAQPSPEQVSTLIARLSALMGETHVGSATLVDSWKPEAFAMTPFQVRSANTATGAAPDALAASHAHSALRRFRLPVPVRVQVAEGRPVRVMTDRRGVSGGVVVQAAGPWRTSGEWWNDPPSLDPNWRRASAGQAPPSLDPNWPRASAGYAAGNLAAASAGQAPTNWDRDEWDVAIADGTVYRVFVERNIGQWFIEGIVD
jgi:protein ImuB